MAAEQTATIPVNIILDIILLAIPDILPIGIKWASVESSGYTSPKI